MFGYLFKEEKSFGKNLPIKKFKITLSKLLKRKFKTLIMNNFNYWYRQDSVIIVIFLTGSMFIVYLINCNVNS